MSPTLRPANYVQLAFFALLPLAAVGGALALPVLLSLVGLVGFRPRMIRQTLENRPLILILLAGLLAWATFSIMWSPYTGPTAPKIIALTSLGLCFIASLGRRDTAALALAAAFSAFAVMGVALGAEALSHAAMNRAAAPDSTEFEANQSPARGLVVLLALVWPVIAWALRPNGPLWRILALCCAIGAGALSLQFGQLSTAVGFTLGLAAFVVAMLAPRLAIITTTAGLTVWMLIAPFATPLLIAASPRLIEALPFSSAARVMIWDYTSARIAEQPWIGHGLDAGRTVNDLVAIRGELLSGIPVHPHSASLQIWYELGLVGAALASAALAYGGWRLAAALQHDRLAAAAAAAVLAMFGFMANIGWSIWQEWWMATLLLAAALLTALAARAARA